MKTQIARHLFLLLAILGAACAKNESSPTADLSKRVIKVTTTTGMIEDIAKRIGGERAAVAALMGPGVDPHLYKATQGDLEKLSGADLILYNGLHLEGKMQDIFEKMAKRTRTLAVTELIPEGSLRTPPEFAGHPDPHVWFDVTLWMKAAERIRAAFIELDPPHTSDYLSRADDLLAEMRSLDEYARTQIATIPAGRRVLVTAHDAFGYFGRAYNLEVMGLQGISTASEFGVRDLDRLIDLIVARGVKAVFVESSVPKQSIEALVRGAESRGHPLKIGGELFSDAMGAAGTPEGNYIGMVRHNVDTIVNALR